MDDRLDRDAVARVFERARAIERTGSPARDDGITPDALVAAAQEVGLDPGVIRDAVAIERVAGAPPSTSRLDRVAGVATVVVERTVVSSPAEVLDVVEEWLRSAHRLRCERIGDEAIVAVRRDDMVATVGRQVAGLRGEGRLGSVRRLRVAAVSLTPSGSPDSGPLEARTFVRVEADRRLVRRAAVGGGATVGVAGVGVGVGALAATQALILVPVVAVPALAGGYAVTRIGRAHADRLETELERLLSAVGRAQRPPRLLDRLTRRVRRA